MCKTVILTEQEFEQAKKNLTPSTYTFNNNIRRFLKVLCTDPVHAEVPKCCKLVGVTKIKLLDMMKKIGLIEYSERLNDKNPDGSFKDKATMKVKYKIKDKVKDDEEFRVPKNKFDDKVEKLRIMIFERNVPEGIDEDILDEGDGGAASCAITGGANTIMMPLFGMYRKQPKHN